MAAFQETPRAGIHEEDFCEAAGNAPIAAAPTMDESDDPKKGKESSRKRGGSLIGWLLSSSTGQAGDFTLLHAGWVAKQGIWLREYKYNLHGRKVYPRCFNLMKGL